MLTDDWVIVGRFGRPHGIKGFVTVISFTDPVENILNYTDWHAFIRKQWHELKIIGTELKGSHLLVRVEDYPDRETVAHLTNVDIAVNKAQLPALEPGEFYWHQLVGLQVVTQNGEVLGSVTEVMATGSNDVLVISGEKRHLVPYLPGRVVLQVDLEKKVITVDWDKDF